MKLARNYLCSSSKHAQQTSFPWCMILPENLRFRQHRVLNAALFVVLYVHSTNARGYEKVSARASNVLKGLDAVLLIACTANVKCVLWGSSRPVTAMNLHCCLQHKQINLRDLLRIFAGIRQNISQAVKAVGRLKTSLYLWW